MRDDLVDLLGPDVPGNPDRIIDHFIVTGGMRVKISPGSVPSSSREQRE
jgi:hypothetical protein